MIESISFNPPQACDEDWFYHMLSNDNSIRNLMLNGPDRISYAIRSKDKIEIFITYNTATYVTCISKAAFDHLKKTIFQEATFEEVCYMLNLRK